MILALHGLLDSPRGFDQLRQLMPEEEIVSPRIPQNRTSLHTRRDWLLAWTKRENLRDFHLLGHSLGGALAALAADDLEPRSLLLLAPVGFGKIPLANILEGPLRHPLRLAAPRLLEVSPIVRSTYRHLFSYGGEIPDFLHEELRRNPALALRRAEREMKIVSHWSREPIGESSFGGPVRALWGEHDRLVPWREGKDILRVFPEAEVSRLPGVGHDLLRENPKALSGWISKSLGSKKENM